MGEHHVRNVGVGGSNPLCSTTDETRRWYWRTNIIVMTVLLALWAAVSLGASILLADTLNQIRLGGFPLGFWFAQQGSMLVFLVLILVYAIVLNRLDDLYHARLRSAGEGQGQ